MHPPNKTDQTPLAGLMLGAIGIVYGDIGTSPLYTLHEVFAGAHAVPTNETNILGILSLIFWALTIVVSLKYVVFIMRADNHGEGGIMALLSLALHTVRAQKSLYTGVMMLGIFGVGLFYGDAMITPAISVLSAVEGLKIVDPSLSAYIVPITLVVLTGLFLLQRHGTGKVGNLFGPIMLFWFLTIAILGFNQIMKYPSVLWACNPFYAINFFIANKWLGFLALGAVVLALTGAEALYADMGHFGRKPITTAWFYFIWPALLLNYFGQGALLLADNTAIQNPFYLLAPDWGLVPLVILSTFATIIASQSVISGTFSMTQQASRLGYLPRIAVLHTSDQHRGQIYVPFMNWALFIAVVGLVLHFKTSSNLADAYGVAVTGTMLITTILAFLVIQNMWKWGLLKTLPLIAIFLVVDLSFFSANILKVTYGGWLPLVIGTLIFVLMVTWKKGTNLIREYYQEAPQESVDNYRKLNNFIETLRINPPLRVTGTAVFLTSNPKIAPRSLLHNLMHNKVLHEKIVILKINVRGIPHVPEKERMELTELKDNFFSMTLNYGFKDDLDVPRVLASCKTERLSFLLMETSFFVGHETLLPAMHSKMYRWQESLFFLLFRNGLSANAFFRIPPNRVVELGAQVEV